MDIPAQKEPVYAPTESQNMNGPFTPPVENTYVQPTPTPGPTPTSVSLVPPPMSGTGISGLFKKLLFGTGTLLGVAILIGGILMLVKKPAGTKAEATIKKADCVKSTDTSSKYAYKCTLELSYMDAENKEVSVNKTIDTNTYYTTGTKVTIYYSPENASEVEIDDSNRTVFGWILVGISILLLLGSGIGLFFAFRSATPTVSPVSM